MGGPLRRNPTTPFPGRRLGPGGVPIIGGGPQLPPVGDPYVRDAYNRVLSVGDQIYVETGRVHPFEVAAITPVVDPNVPPEIAERHLEIIVVSKMRFLAEKNVRNQEFVRIATKAEFRVPVALQTEDPPPPPGDGDRPPDGDLERPEHDDESAGDVDVPAEPTDPPAEKLE